ncbi:MAG: TRAP transporter large permease [Desulfobacterales bacterium]|nr:MAG: TRAP transporter large permease [Desulfobacterales bacterium]
MILTVLIGALLIAMVLGVPIAWCLGISGLAAIMLMDIPLTIVPQKIFSGMDIFPMLCLPFFILAGEIMAHGGLSKRLLNFAVIGIGSVRGGLALANVIASMLFGGITGAATADASALGSVEIPMMVKNGYDARFSAAITAASACIGPIIPPSLPVVIYALAVSGVSIGGLFAAGMLPGILVGVALMITSYIISVRRSYPKREYQVHFREVLTATKDAVLAIITPVIIIGGIIGGIFTPTEAASVAVVYSFIISFFVYRELKLADLPAMFLRSGVISAVVMIIIATANVFGVVVAFEQLAQKLEGLVRPLGYYGFILTINIIFLIVGMFMDQNPAILILAPVFAPIAANLGIEPIHFGIIVIMNLVIGLITPPLGQVLFVVSPIADVSFEEVAKEVFVFILVEIGVLLLVSYVPFISTFMPKMFGYIH